MRGSGTDLRLRLCGRGSFELYGGSVMEQPCAGEGQHHAVFVGGGDDLVVPDGAAQNIGDVVLLQAVDDAIVDFLFFNELRDGTMIPDPVQQVQVVVVAVGLILGGVNVLAQGSM